MAVLSWSLSGWRNRGIRPARHRKRSATLLAIVTLLGWEEVIVTMCSPRDLPLDQRRFVGHILSRQT
jgi:hypothetical protein